MSGHDPTMPVAGQINKAQVSGGGAIDADLVIANRSGDVLIKHTVLKADHFPSCHNTKLTPILEGAPNFRKVEGIQVYGVAIPTVAGLRQVVNTMMACNGVRKVYWQNLREEPLVFINGNPFVVREADQPFNNLEYTGIDRSRVEDMELRLKADILAEAAQFDNQILVMHENEDLSLYDHWEPVTAADVQTPQEVYAELKADGYDVDYLRVPITDEKAPKDEDFEELIHRLWAIPEDAGIIFNCQMGRGRTTTGMVIAALLWLRRMESFPVKKGKPETRASVPAWFRQAAGPLAARGVSPLAAKEGTLEGRLKAGNYGAVRSLLRALEKGNEAKVVLDAVIDACGAMQNLREGIASYRARFAKEAREKQRNLLLSVCLEYLERYYMLISFAGYLTSTAFDPGSPHHQSFPAWMAARPELRSILMRLLRRNSMAALELHQRSPSLGGGDMPSEGSERVDPDKDVVASRSGAVLGAFSILKEDNFPGMQSNKLAQSIEGAPNFRGLPRAPIFGVGMPTLDGITGVLQVVSGARSQGAGRRCSALWINMREEPVVYVNGRPFVLREESRPLKNMMEYAGIDAARLEAMEERLKKDVLAEALRHGGRILVAHESFEYGHYGELYDTWEEIDHPDAVATPAEVYSGLTRQGFAVKYVRIPVTDGTAPTLADFDSVIAAIMDFGLQNPVVFNCQMGIGRTTTGMVIASLIHMYTEGALQTARTLPQQLDDISWEDVSQLHGYLAAGMSPRSDNEEHDDDHHDAEDEKLVRVWDLEPEEAAEQKALAAGGYVGVRRVVRLLEEGEDAKRTLDAVVDSASDLLNLRVSIMKYRKPRSSYKFLRPELQQRGAAFKKGSAYLERYCLLLVFAYYLEHVGPEAVPFSAWVDSRPDLQAALNSLHLNPGAALAPLPLPKQPVVLADGEEGDLLRDQDKVLSKRKGRLLNKRTILKSYLFYEDDPALTAVQQKKKPKVPEAPDLKKAQEGLPIYSVGSLTASGLRAVMRWMGAAAGGPSHVCISDIREELVVYVNGTPYTRRELEMPAAALHHAGIHASQLEEQEALMKEDVQDEVASFSGRILLHKELNAQLAALISQAARITLSGTSIPPTPSPTLTSTPTPPPPATMAPHPLGQQAGHQAQQGGQVRQQQEQQQQ
ncbi:inositol hexakisphosphate-domain-containing protein [Haematococcus lacustris]